MNKNHSKTMGIIPLLSIVFIIGGSLILLKVLNII